MTDEERIKKIEEALALWLSLDSYVLVCDDYDIFLVQLGLNEDDRVNRDAEIDEIIIPLDDMALDLKNALEKKFNK